MYRERLLAQNLHEHPVELAANDASRLDRYSPMTPRLTLKPLLKPRSKRSNWPGRGLSSSRGGCVSSFVYYSVTERVLLGLSLLVSSKKYVTNRLRTRYFRGLGLN